MTEKRNVVCEYLVNGRFCGALTEEGEGKQVRSESCTNKAKDSCCYLCSDQESCEISCAYLDTTEETARLMSDLSRSRSIHRTQNGAGKMNEEKELMRSTYKTGAFSKTRDLILTTKRLIMGEESIPLSDILEAYNKSEGFMVVASKLVIRLKDGTERECTPKFEGSQTGLFFNPELALSKSVDRWVTLINRVLASTPIS